MPTLERTLTRATLSAFASWALLNTSHAAFLSNHLLLHLDSGCRFWDPKSVPFTVWAAAVRGGGRQLNRSQAWTINVRPGTAQARIWAWTKCTFDSSGRSRWETGYCNGLLQCQACCSPPNTLAEYALNQFNSLDFFDIWLVDGFNVPMDYSPISGGCRGIRCSTDINGQCPNLLRDPGGCNPCTVLKADRYCWNSGTCRPTEYSGFYKQRCLDVIATPRMKHLHACPGGTNYRVIFCPWSSFEQS